MIVLKRNDSKFYLLNDEEEVVFHYIPIMLEPQKISISPDVWVTDMRIFVEETVDNIGENCIAKEEYTKSGLTISCLWV